MSVVKLGYSDDLTQMEPALAHPMHISSKELDDMTIVNKLNQNVQSRPEGSTVEHSHSIVPRNHTADIKFWGSIMPCDELHDLCLIAVATTRLTPKAPVLLPDTHRPLAKK